MNELSPFRSIPDQKHGPTALENSSHDKGSCIPVAIFSCAVLDIERIFGSKVFRLLAFACRLFWIS